MIYYSAEIEEYEEANTKVKLLLYKNTETRGNKHIHFVTEIPEFPRNQAEGVVRVLSKSIMRKTKMTDNVIQLEVRT